MIVVSDASPIISLAAIDRLHLLEDLYGPAFIPEAVFRELTAKSTLPGSAEVSNPERFIVEKVEDRNLVTVLKLELDLGEAEAIALALEKKAALLLIDERRGRKVAAELGIDVLGTIGILVEAKMSGKIPTLKGQLDALISKSGFRISGALYRHALQLVAEE